MIITNEDVRLWLRYLHHYLEMNNDGRTSQIREILYSEQGVKNVQRNPLLFIQNFDDAYPNIKPIETFIRDYRIDKIFE